MNDLTRALLKSKGITQHFLHEHSPAILTALGVSGTISTAYLAGKASYHAALIIAEDEAIAGTHDDVKERLKGRTKLVWRLYIPAAMSGGLTIATIITANTVSTRRTAAIAAAYSLTDKAFTEYKEKVVETIGEKKATNIKDSIVQDALERTPPPDNLLILTGPGEVLCREHFTGRYFVCDMETLKKAQNDINAKLHRELYATLSDFYEMVGLEQTTMSDETGWSADKQLELYFSAALAEGGKPCISFEYNYAKLL